MIHSCGVNRNLWRAVLRALSVLICIGWMFDGPSPAAWTTTTRGTRSGIQVRWEGRFGLSPGQTFVDLRGEWAPSGTNQWTLGWSRAYVYGYWHAYTQFPALVDVRGFLDYIGLSGQQFRIYSNVLSGI